MDPIVPVLRAVAAVVRSRPGAAGLPAPDELVRTHRPLLFQAIARSPGLRKRAAEILDADRPGKRTTGLATLLLHPDASVVGAALDGVTADPRLDRADRTIRDLRKKLDSAKRKVEYAQRDVNEAKRLVAEITTARDELDERVESLAEQLAIAQRRFQEPRPLASALLRILEQPPAGLDEDSAARDPHNPAPARPDHNRLLLTSAEAAGLAPEELLRILRAVVDPPPPRVAVTAELDLRVTPLGGATEIGGSCLLVEAGGTRILIDAGLRPGTKAAPPRDIKRALDGPLHGLVITHAHNDHCGYVPALTALRPDLRILATRETVRLMPVMWADTAKIMRQRARDAARWGSDVTVLYGNPEIEAAARRCEEVPFGSERRLGALTVELFPAGHILGAAGAVVRAGDRRIVVTGDISGFRQETVDGYALPPSAREPDLLVMETTCCAEDHDTRETRVHDLVRAVGDVCRDGGRVLIPAFALGRAQEIALLLRRHIPEIPVRIDGMAVDLSRAFQTMTEADPRPISIFGGAVTAADRPTELDTFRTGVVISTSGMLTGGPAVQWARRILPEPGSALFISGYQDEESPGRALLDLAETGGDFTLPDHGAEVTVPVRARVETMRLSAHADRRALLDIAEEVAPQEIMLVHGLAGRQRTFAETLRLRHHHPTTTALWRSH